MHPTERASMLIAYMGIGDAYSYSLFMYDQQTPGTPERNYWWVVSTDIVERVWRTKRSTT